MKSGISNILKAKSKEEIEDLERRGFRRDSGKWIFQIDISGLINEFNKKEDVKKFRLDLIDLLKSKIEDVNLFAGAENTDKFKNIIKRLTDSLNEVNDVDKILDELYEWSDDNNVWIESEKNEK